MKIVKKIVLALRFILLDQVFSMKIKKMSGGDYFIAETIPYQCQFATPELVADILEKRIKGEDDPNWNNFGFPDREEYAYWSWRACGVACLKMVVDFYALAGKTIGELTYEGVKLGGYDVSADRGWFYKPLLNQAQNYGLTGYTVSHFGIASICELMKKKRFFVASVNPSLIRFDKTGVNEEPGGHLVLVIGCRVKSGAIEGFFIHNPSGKLDETRRKTFIPIDVFNKAYSKKGIAIWR
ncbi:MAG: hypothetical protein UY31_C0012G0012 [Candidatus Wolfebacteria bacterium GW2011_GWE1_48_7]|uniref:Peptidase C39-like domain-containing protein n=2 Tax=Candidatus Wolfeibacteriota TaxID=1752735 RepID=A0A0G1U828_9BACT|nr:MAG: hypothetical protein UX70_C0001G0539 [Candidatus Wolfebacteria bacterium GW2011_GWB1_47_1]KKU36983.1 MAG: hypothetical protein UX49_C0004G0002 [Candidatus Wolfebacteria bacterium GW2011_GWC2_46_275]KKU42523.1 MAG: hypothetical protein UX58_C0002G0237 [Candidatus Wolfebacteria bacterium GW2011_GWB2_46_69]KKU53900.1 MAG: hypothetical protein UX76_C0008G0023 [Candidatus Wolfebacteria bacterium GW2011_GWC1_47_103]KKU59676.1 MAG: hypothetical protein UX83_C0003G0091 [Candidatus Wolfebacteria